MLTVSNCKLKGSYDLTVLAIRTTRSKSKQRR